MIRLNKYLAQCGIASRRACDQVIASGRVQVNGQVITSLGLKINEAVDQITVDGNLIHPSQDRFYIALYKPAGYVTTLADEKGRPKVIDLVPVPVRVFPVGRLDETSEGLLLLTNDGDTSYRLLHPGFKVTKTYEVTLDKDVSDVDLTKIRRGIHLGDGITQPCQAEYLDPRTKNFIGITLKEGRKRQIRRMFRSLKYNVKKLKRTHFGPISLGPLKPGQWRYLSDREIKSIKIEPDVDERINYYD